MDGQRSTEIEVDARRRWNETDISVESNVAYQIEVLEGRWNDWYIPSGPQGYQRWWLAPLALLTRFPSARLFALIGAIDHGNMFVVGEGITICPPVGGRLSFFANDITFMYWNNRGSIKVLVSRLGRCDD